MLSDLEEFFSWAVDKFMATYIYLSIAEFCNVGEMLEKRKRKKRIPEYVDNIGRIMNNSLISAKSHIYQADPGNPNERIGTAEV